MVPNEQRRVEVLDLDQPDKIVTVAQPKAVTCDLCDAEGKLSVPKPRCVSSCPHEAAFRMSGEQLLQRVMEGASKNV
jgi:Fe-S-cluster-containing hydrogenase component 2